MTNEQKEIVWKVAEAFNLNPALVCAIIAQESGWNPWLVRYEPHFENHVAYGPVVRSEATAFVRQASFTVTLDTEIKQRCMSWGAMQVMGQVAREHGFIEPLAKLCDFETGVLWGCRTLQRMFNRRQRQGMEGEDLVARVLLDYNGGGNPSYAQHVLNRLSEYA